MLRTHSFWALVRLSVDVQSVVARILLLARGLRLLVGPVLCVDIEALLEGLIRLVVGIQNGLKLLLFDLDA